MEPCVTNIPGIFDEEEKTVLVTLFRLCEQFKLPRMVPLKPSEITYSERFLVQSCTAAAAHADRDSSGSDSGSFCAYFSADFRQYLRQKVRLLLPSVCMYVCIIYFRYWICY